MFGRRNSGIIKVYDNRQVVAAYLSQANKKVCLVLGRSSSGIDKDVISGGGGCVTGTRWWEERLVSGIGHYHISSKSSSSSRLSSLQSPTSTRSGLTNTP